MKRRDFIAGLGSAVVCPVAAGAQQRALPVIGYIGVGAGELVSKRATIAFLKGLSETGYADGRNVMIEYHWSEG
jgi:putative tryptophan/tyrosine transport system substrate-binding protein